MQSIALATLAIMSLTFSVTTFAGDRSLKGSSLENTTSQEVKTPRQQERMEDMRTVVGGSLGGAENGNLNEQREEERKAEQPALTCEEALERCSVK